MLEIEKLLQKKDLTCEDLQNIKLYLLNEGCMIKEKHIKDFTGNIVCSMYLEYKDRLGYIFDASVDGTYKASLLEVTKQYLQLKYRG